jgi:hypothetical protein
MEEKMKERSLLYFVTAVVATLFLVVAIIIRLFPWFNLYGNVVLPQLHKLIIPVALLWVGWYFENKSFLLSSSIIFAVLLGFHMDYSGLLNGGIFVVSTYAPMVRTVYVLGFLLQLAVVGLGFFTIFELNKPKAE